MAFSEKEIDGEKSIRLMVKKYFLLFTAFVLLNFCILAKPLEEQNPEVKSIFVLSEKILHKENLTADEMIKASLYFDFVQPGSDYEKTYLEKFRTYVKKLKGSFGKNLSEEEKAGAILDFLYEKIIFQYEENQNHLDVTFDEGRYNCVTSSILYAAFCKACGIQVEGNLVPGHVYCSVIVDGQRIDVECTNPAGFDPKTSASGSNRGGQYNYVPASRYKNSRPISDKMLVSLIPKNLAAELNEQKDFEKAVPLAYTRFLFLKEENSPENDGQNVFEITCNNYVSDLQKGENYRQVLSWMDQWYETFSFSKRLTEIYQNAVYNEMVEQLYGENFQEAENIINSHKNILSRESVEENRQIIFIARMENQLVNLPVLDGIEETQKLMQSDLYKSSKEIKNKVDEWFVYFAVQHSNSFFQDDNDLEAAKTADKYLQILPGNAALKGLSNTHWHNYDVAIHNKVAPLFNSKKYSEAKVLLEEGLKNHPDSIMLKNDLERVKKLL